MSTQNILFVDDSKPLVQLFLDFMSKEGRKYRLLTAGNGAEALKVLDVEKVDLVVLDIQMPVMDGLQFLAELHNRRIWLPVIIMTGANVEISEKKFGEFGIVDYLKKPVAFDDLDRRIGEILRRIENRDLISGISIFGILQVLEMEKKTGILTLKIGAKDGKVFFKDGKVADIEADGLVVEDALNEFIKPDMETKKLNIEYINHRRENKINKSLTQMLLEAAKDWDEKNKPKD
jgi:DNA-binding response OmpR family regulator